MLEQYITAQLKSYLENVKQNIVVLSVLNESAKSAELHQLLTEIVVLTDKIILITEDNGYASSCSTAKQGK